MGSDLGNVLTVWVKLQGKFPAACRQIRLDIVRCIISNVERLGQFAVGAERDLYATAMRFQVRIVCFEVVFWAALSPSSALHSRVRLPHGGVNRH